MIFFLSLPLFITLVSKSDADVSKTSVWLAYWGASSKKSSAFGCCLCTSEYIILFSTFFNLFFFNSERLGDISISVKILLNTDRDRTIGSQGCGTINNNGERLLNFCLNNNCVIGVTIFKHKYIHKLTLKSPDGKTVNQIEHVVINNKLRRSL